MQNFWTGVWSVCIRVSLSVGQGDKLNVSLSRAGHLVIHKPWKFRSNQIQKGWWTFLFLLLFWSCNCSKNVLKKYLKEIRKIRKTFKCLHTKIQMKKFVFLKFHWMVSSGVKNIGNCFLSSWKIHSLLEHSARFECEIIAGPSLHWSI